MPKLLVICVEGVSASSRKEKDTTSSVVKEVLNTFSTSYSLCELKPTWWYFRKKKIVEELNKSNFTDGVLFVGKSLGAAKLLQDLDKFDLRRFGKSVLFTIDPHDPIDSNVFYKPKKVDICHNVYQQNVSPAGFPVYNALNHKDYYSDHFSIIKSKMTRGVLSQAISDLIK